MTAYRWKRWRCVVVNSETKLEPPGTYYRPGNNGPLHGSGKGSRRPAEGGDPQLLGPPHRFNFDGTLTTLGLRLPLLHFSP